MALLYVDGFDYMGSFSDLKPNVHQSVTYSGSTRRNIVGGRVGGAAVGLGYHDQLRVGVNTTSMVTGMVCGFAAYLIELGSNGTQTQGNDYRSIFTFDKGSAQSGGEGSLSINDVGKLFFRGSGYNGLVDCNHVMAFNEWHYYELELHNGWLTLYIDGIKIHEDNTLTYGSEIDLLKWSIINISSPPGPGHRFGVSLLLDDVYFLDKTTSVNNAPLGDVRIQTLQPISDTTVSWTAANGSDNYKEVDEVSGDGDSTYNETNAVGNTDLFGFAALPDSPDKIFGVNVLAQARKTDSSALSLKLAMNDGTKVVSAAKPVDVSYTLLEHLFEQDSAGASWTKTTLDGSSFGYESS